MKWVETFDGRGRRMIQVDDTPVVKETEPAKEEAPVVEEPAPKKTRTKKAKAE